MNVPLLVFMCICTCVHTCHALVNKYVPRYKEQEPNDTITCIDLGDSLPKIKGGVYIIFIKSNNHGIYVGKSENDITERLAAAWKIYRNLKIDFRACYAEMSNTYPPTNPQTNLNAFGIENIILSTFCFNGNSIYVGGNGYFNPFKPQATDDTGLSITCKDDNPLTRKRNSEKEGKNYLPDCILNLSCNAGDDGDVLRVLKYYVRNVENIPKILERERSVLYNTTIMTNDRSTDDL